jgi:hypothetical protein
MGKLFCDVDEPLARLEAAVSEPLNVLKRLNGT